MHFNIHRKFPISPYWPVPNRSRQQLPHLLQENGLRPHLLKFQWGAESNLHRFELLCLFDLRLWGRDFAELDDCLLPSQIFLPLGEKDVEIPPNLRYGAAAWRSSRSVFRVKVQGVILRRAQRSQGRSAVN